MFLNKNILFCNAPFPQYREFPTCSDSLAKISNMQCSIYFQCLICVNYTCSVSLTWSFNVSLEWISLCTSVVTFSVSHCRDCFSALFPRFFTMFHWREFFMQCFIIGIIMQQLSFILYHEYLLTWSSSVLATNRLVRL